MNDSLDRQPDPLPAAILDPLLGPSSARLGGGIEGFADIVRVEDCAQAQRVINFWFIAFSTQSPSSSLVATTMSNRKFAGMTPKKHSQNSAEGEKMTCGTVASANHKCNWICGPLARCKTLEPQFAGSLLKSMVLCRARFSQPIRAAVAEPPPKSNAHRPADGLVTVAQEQKAGFLGRCLGSKI